MSHVAFVGGIGNGAAENVVSRFAFCKITSVGSGAVTIDEVYVFGGESGIIERQTHGCRHLFRSGAGDVLAVGIGAVT